MSKEIGAAARAKVNRGYRIVGDRSSPCGSRCGTTRGNHEDKAADTAYVAVRV